MKEMLFIIVAILIPPTLTYLGFVGGSGHQNDDKAWASERQLAEKQPEVLPAAHKPAQEHFVRWYESR